MIQEGTQDQKNHHMKRKKLYQSHLQKGVPWPQEEGVPLPTGGNSLPTEGKCLQLGGKCPQLGETCLPIGENLPTEGKFLQ